MDSEKPPFVQKKEILLLSPVSMKYEPSHKKITFLIVDFAYHHIFLQLNSINQSFVIHNALSRLHGHAWPAANPLGVSRSLCTISTKHNVA